MSQSISDQTQSLAAKRNKSISLQTRFVLLMLFLALVPLIIISTHDTLQTQQALTNLAEISLGSSAAQTASSLDAFIQTTLDSIANEAQFTDFVTYLTLLPASSPMVQARALDLLNKLGDKDNEFIISYALVDPEGMVLLDTRGFNFRDNESTEAYFSMVRFSDEPVVTAVTYSEGNTRTMTFASKIVNIQSEYLGILRVVYDAAVLQDVITQSVGSSPDTTVLLLDQLYIRMADSQNPELIQKSVVPLVLADYLMAVRTHSFLDIPREEQATNYLDLESGLDNAVNQPFFTADITPGIAGDDSIAVAILQTQPWTVAYSRPTSVFLADVQEQTRTNVILVVAVSILITVLATLVVRSLTSPIISLTKTANSISQGDLHARAEIKTTGEIGVLASTFNRMSSQIQELVGNLERRVEQRTSDLEQTSRQSEKRAQDLQTITEVARFLSTEKDFERLLSLITQAVSERFGFYHVGIFLLDEAKRFAVLRASNSPGGRQMLLRQHRLEVGQTGIVGNVTATGTPRIAVETGVDAIYFNNPNLPDTRSEMALPLTARGSILGALDVQSTVPNAFSDSDISVLGLLADQIAIAIDNVHLIEESQSALAESRAIFSEYLAEAWKRKTGSGVLGYHQSLTGGTLITDTSAPEFDKIYLNGDKSLEIPIRVREQVIGVLNVRSISRDREWSADDVGVVQAVAERLGLALDNARLFEETSIRASRERLVTEITTKIRSTNSPQEMIKTAVDELQRALGATRVEIIPKEIAPPPDQ